MFNGTSRTRDQAPEAADDPAEGMSKVSTPESVRRELGGLIGRARNIEIEAFVAEPEQARRRHIPALHDIVDQAIVVLGRLETMAADSASPQGRRLWARIMGALAPREAFEEVENLCFFAASELREGGRLLGGLAAGDAFAVAAVAEWTQGRLIHGLCAVERRLSDLIGQPAHGRHVDLLRDALVARRLLVRFRIRVDGAVAGSGDSVARLRSAGAAIAWMLGHDGARSLRASDRLMAKTLQGRLSEALRRPVGEAATAHLLQEIASFASLTNLINSRQELVVHDRTVLERVASDLSPLDDGAPIPASLAEGLATIRGRDTRLDEMIETEVDVGTLANEVLRVLSDISGRTGSEGLVAEGSARPETARQDVESSSRPVPADDRADDEDDAVAPMRARGG